jgi:S-adenosylmethionine synthetase
VDSTVIMRMVDRKKKDFESYEKTKKTYDKDLEKYDDEITTEKEREKDFFKNAFEPKTKISSRPNQPS